MEKICFATNSAKKIEEVAALLKGRAEILSLSDIGCFEELPEEQDTIAGNSEQKARYVWERYGVPCFADDTGLEVEALGGAPGVYSARFAGSQRNDADNVRLLLSKLEGAANRRACFRTVMTLMAAGGQMHQFEGIAPGQIIAEPRGTGGFGYDPVFVPEGYELTFAQMPLAEKNQISHRAKALRQLVAFFG